MEKQFKSILADLTIDEDYLKLALDYLNSVEKNSGSAEKAMRLSLQSAYDACQTRLVNLSREFTSPLNSTYELYTPEEFKKQKLELKSERNRLETEMGGTKEKLDQSLESAERVFTFCSFALQNFNTDDLTKKRAIFGTIGSNLTLIDKKLSIERLHPYLLIENELRSQRKLYEGLEPGKKGYTKEKEAIFQASIPDWLRRQDSNL